MNGLSLPYQCFDEHMAGVAITNQIIKAVGLVFVGKVVNAIDVMNIKFPSQFSLSDPAHLTPADGMSGSGLSARQTFSSLEDYYEIS